MGNAVRGDAPYGELALESKSGNVIVLKVNGDGSGGGKKICTIVIYNAMHR